MAEEKHESDLTRQEKARMRWELIRSLKGKERFAYLWTYYKSYLVLLAILLAGISLLVTCIRNITTRELLSIAVSDVDPETETGRERLEEDLMELLGSGRGREKVTLDTSLQSGESAAMLMKWSVIIGGESTDLLICDGSVWENYQNAFKPWRKFWGNSTGTTRNGSMRKAAWICRPARSGRNTGWSAMSRYTQLCSLTPKKTRRSWHFWSTCFDRMVHER